MGVDVDVHIGPFVECIAHPMDTVVSLESCTDTTCNNHGKEYVSKPFCNLCGGKTGMVSKTEVRYLDLHKVYDKLQDKMTEVYRGMCDDLQHGQPTKHVWVGNVRIDGRSTSCDPEHDVFFEYLSAPQVNQELISFCEKFANEIELLKNEYGADNVKVRWGYFNYCS